MSNAQVIPMKGNLVGKKDLRSGQLSFKLPEADKIQFNGIVKGSGGDATGVLRQFVREFIAKDGAQVAAQLENVRRAELTAHIMDRLTEFAASRRNDAPFLAVMEELLGFDRGTLIALTQD